MSDTLNPGTTNAPDPGAQEAAKYGLYRSYKWPETEKVHLMLEPACVACGRGTYLQVHHILPFHFCILLGRPELELDQRNLITLCSGPDNHHLLLGHLDDFQSYHKDVRMAATGPYKGLTMAAIRADAAWQMLVKGRPPAWEQMTDEEKGAFRQLMDAMYPSAPAAAN